MKFIGVLLAVLLVAVWAPAQKGSQMSREEYDKQASAALQELKENPTRIKEASKAALAKSVNLSPSDKLMEVFDVDAAFTVQSMLLLLATKNGIKREDAFISEFTAKSREVSGKLHGNQIIFLGLMSANLVDQNRKALPWPGP